MVNCSLQSYTLTGILNANSPSEEGRCYEAFNAPVYVGAISVIHSKLYKKRKVKIMKNSLALCIYLISALSISLLLSCDDSSVNSNTKNYEPGTREYVWNEYLLSDNSWKIYTAISELPNGNVLIASMDADIEERFIEYDGDSLNYLTIPQFFYPFGAKYDGISKVWMNAMYGEIWMYENNRYKLSYKFEKSDSISTLIANIYIKSPNEVFAIGSTARYNPYRITSMIFKYSGNGRQKFLPEIENIHFRQMAIDKTSNKLIFAGDKMLNSLSDSAVYYIYDGRYLSPYLFASARLNRARKDIVTLDGFVYLCYGLEIYKISEGRAYLYRSFENTIAVPSLLIGRHEEDFFLRTNEGIGHYNGTDIKTLYPFSNINRFSGVITENDVYLLIGTRDFKSILLHGEKKSK